MARSLLGTEGWVCQGLGAAATETSQRPRPGSADPPLSPSMFQLCHRSFWVFLKLQWASSKFGCTKLFTLLLCVKDRLKAPETPLQQAAAGSGEGIGGH